MQKIKMKEKIRRIGSLISQKDKPIADQVVNQALATWRGSFSESDTSGHPNMPQ